jgi:membrane associated rhomboid family serine protease
VGVFGLWQYGFSSFRQFGDPDLLNFMLKHFMNSSDGWEHHRWHILLTSAFSHQRLDHLGINMLVLYSMGKGVIEAIGASRFLLLYCGAGIAGSLGTTLYREYLRPAMVNNTSSNGRTQMQPMQSIGSLGASGKSSVRCLDIDGLTNKEYVVYDRVCYGIDHLLRLCL